MSHIAIAGRTFGAGRCLIVGEVAQSHDGSLGLAHAFIDAVADAGADAVKFQTHIASAESTPGEPWRVKWPAERALQELQGHTHNNVRPYNNQCGGVLEATL